MQDRGSTSALQQFSTSAGAVAGWRAVVIPGHGIRDSSSHLPNRPSRVDESGRLPRYVERRRHRHQGHGEPVQLLAGSPQHSENQSPKSSRRLAHARVLSVR